MNPFRILARVAVTLGWTYTAVAAAIAARLLLTDTDSDSLLAVGFAVCLAYLLTDKAGTVADKHSGSIP